MKRVTLSLFCLLLSAGLMAQKIYFIYLQTENQQPFFVRMNEKVFSSSASGYLILSKLIDSTYNYKVGFPGKNVDLNFSTTINKKDHGYLLRNLGEKGWGLIDLQTLSIQMPIADVRAAAEVNLKLDSNINAFTELLSKAADDSTLKYISVVKEEKKKQDELKSDIIQPVVKIDIPSTTNADEKKTEIVKNEPEKKIEDVKTDTETEKKQPVIVKETPYKRSEVTKIGQNNVNDGVEIVYSDKQSEKTDTITIVIDQPKSSVLKTEEKNEENKPEKKFLDISTDSLKTTNDQLQVKKEEKPEENKVEKKDPEISADSSKTVSDASPEKKIELKKLWPFNKNKTGTKQCEVADNNDFLKLRRKMAARTNDDGMIDESKKYFKSRCFTTEQIKNLSSMFLSNAGKYHFFDAAFEYVADKENFSSLQSELKDEYYSNRFKAILQN
jgi:hypothetical protein